MGVLGLTPFIQKTCPDIIKRLPDRLQGFSGKRIVLDGTLLTQRFHFTQIPHPYRHVLGWYRLIKELEEFGVEAVCVFDGKERNSAKAQETLRRQSSRRLTAARALVESERLTRLNQISTAMSNISKLSSPEKAQVSSVLAHLTTKQPDSPGLEKSNVLPLTKESIASWDTPWSYPRVWSIGQPSEHEFGRLMDEWSSTYSQDMPTSPPSPLDTEEAFLEESSVSVNDDIPHSDEPSPTQDRDTALELVEPFEHTPSPSETPLTIPSIPGSSIDETYTNAELEVSKSLPPASTVNTILSTLTPLYLDYQNSIPKVTSIPMHAANTPVSSSGTDIEPLGAAPEMDQVEVEAQEAFEMSKRQYQLTLMEGKFWDNLFSPLDVPSKVVPVEPPSESSEGMLQELTHRSNLMSESYRVRTNPPTMQTYAECKDILQAMGVSCIDCNGPFEAEALASSLVLNGYADYVASEDTDVLVYEAPLIRNITSRQQPLIVISGAELRSMLNLTRSMFVDFALLMGTDFSQRIRNIGPSRALDFIRAHGSIEKVIEAETRFKPKLPTEDYLKQVNLARSVFQTLPPVPEDATLWFRDVDGEKRTSTSRQSDVLFVMGKYGLSREVEWDTDDALKGGYFDDDPSTIEGNTRL